jgi:hypothetical protein
MANLLSTNHSTSRTPGRRVWTPRILLIILLLGGWLGGARSAAAAGARPGVPQAGPPPFKAHATVTLRINIASHVLCANHDYPVYVTPSEAGGEYTDLKGRTHQLAQTNLPARRIEAFVQDTGVATISPPRAQTGWDEGNTINGVMAANFMLHASKPGATRVYFETSIFGQYLGPGVDIKVIQCKYKIQISHRGGFNAGGLIGTSSAAMSTTISGEEAVLSGSGTFKLGVTQYLPPFCSGARSVTPVEAKITGQVSEANQLELSIAYAPGTTTSGQLTCPYIGTVGNSNAVSPTDLLNIQSASLPAEGGTRSFSYTCWGGSGSCTLTVTATPLK